MGRTRPKSKTKQSIEHPAAPSVPALLEKAQDLITQCDYPLALRFVQRILEAEPSHVVAKEMLAIVQLELGDIELGRNTFLELLSPPFPSPPPPSAHLYLAQLSDDPNDALKHYQSAVDILMDQLNSAPSSDPELKTTIIRALIAMVEIWMDPECDLCFSPSAPDTCDQLLATALQVDPGNPEALQSLASVRLSQARPEEAKECVEKAWIAWKDLDPDSPSLPPLSTQLSLAKILLELHLYVPALSVLKGITSADDEDVEAWYLGGWACWLMLEAKRESDIQPNLEDRKNDAEDNWDAWTWEELGKEARERLERCQMLHIATSHPDTPILEHTKELVAQLEAIGVHHSEDDEEEDGEGWEDVDSSGEEDVEMS